MCGDALDDCVGDSPRGEAENMGPDSGGGDAASAGGSVRVDDECECCRIREEIDADDNGTDADDDDEDDDGKGSAERGASDVGDCCS
jgi:hypothetical protein